MTTETTNGNAAVNSRLFSTGRKRGYAERKRNGYSEPQWAACDGIESDEEARNIYSAGWRVGQAEAVAEPQTFFYRLYSDDIPKNEKHVVSVEAPDSISGMHILYASGAYSVDSCCLVPCNEPKIF